MTLKYLLAQGNVLLNILRDPRWFQIIFLSGFLSFGILELGWKANWIQYGVVISASLLTQLTWIRYKRISLHSLKSSAITALGLSLLLKSDLLWVHVLAAVVAISLKFLIRINGKHIFNPANAGIITVILLSGHAWISPGQWGSSLVLLFFFGAAGAMILLKISRLETGLAYFTTYFLLSTAYSVLYLGWPMDVVIHKITNGSLLLFSFFMITDPMTIPNNRLVRPVWAVMIAVITFYLEEVHHVRGAGLWILFFISPLTPVIDRLTGGSKYQWGIHNIQITQN